MEELKEKISKLNQDDFNEIKRYILEISEPEWYVELLNYLSYFFENTDDTAHYSSEIKNILGDWMRKDLNWPNGIGE